MALILKPEKTYIPSSQEASPVSLESDSYYAVIDHVEFNKREKELFLQIEIFGSKELRDQGKGPIDRMSIFVNDVSFDWGGGLTFAQAYGIAMMDPRLADWTGDE